MFYPSLGTSGGGERLFATQECEQPGTVDLPGMLYRQVGHHQNGLGSLVGGQVLVGVLANLLLRDGASNCGADPVSPLLIGDAEHGDVSETSQATQDSLDLGGVDIDSTANDEVATASFQVEKSIVV
jgi:hypothetical protein